MTVFVVISRTASPALDRAIATAFPDASHRFSDTTWLVSSKQTARQVSEKLGVKRGGQIKGTIVVAASGAYYGLASSAVWDWLRSAVEGDDE